MTMRLQNTLSRTLEELPPAPGPVGMYVCGPTVYQRIHIGNARPFVLSLWLKRWLEATGYQVKLVENITDVNDKIYDAAAKQSRPSAELATEAAQWYVEDTDRLGLGRPDVEPLATETIPEIIALIAELVERELAYESGGDVYFRVAKWPSYGELSGAKLDDMVAQEPSDLKEDQRDFALWKATKPNEDTSWDSPWGAGRPAWHIECSAMAEKYLGPSFEIHGGGLDLRFPHHENELAQSRGAGHEFARIWAHNGMLQLDEEKMSKSVGNIISLKDVLDRWGREAVLLLFLGAHYRSPLDFSEEAMAAAQAQAETFKNHFVGLEDGGGSNHEWPRLAEILDDDFNTSDALALLHNWRARGESELLRRALHLFGLESVTAAHEAPAELRALAERRQEARARGDFDEADILRAEIEARGWEVRDAVEGFVLVER
jgi:cysteinyl-tRNA synthetase